MNLVGEHFRGNRIMFMLTGTSWGNVEFNERSAFKLVGQCLNYNDINSITETDTKSLHLPWPTN